MSVEFNTDGTVKVTDEVLEMESQGHLKVHRGVEFSFTAMDKSKQTITYDEVEPLTINGCSYLKEERLERTEDERNAKRGRKADGAKTEYSVIGEFYNSHEGRIRQALKNAKNAEIEGPEKALNKAREQLRKAFPGLSDEQINAALQSLPGVAEASA